MRHREDALRADQTHRVSLFIIFRSLIRIDDSSTTSYSISFGIL
uniref:Uncharacterized protein n=1 Tax=uncultured Verrucomicrobiales bacterium HF0010_05E02 TaxID=710995 RepID=E0XQQ5_9BACT|nr:hypothetical protein [uncultured Verrucomicrobiales bacterium HF0010_05E02]